MNKITKTILIGSIAVFSAGFLLINPTQANANGITITPEPIFEVDNFAPGQSVTTTITITNNSGKNYEQITLNGEATTNEANFASALELKVDDLAEKNLGSLLAGDSLVLSGGINNGETKTFNFRIRFKEGGETDNQYQGKNLIFNFIFLFEGNEGAEQTVMGVFGSSGSTVNFYIFNENTTNVGSDNVTITWQTNYPSTTQVLYATAAENHTLDLSDNTGIPPKYGYAHTTPEYDTAPKVTFHSITISSLIPGTTYYYRCVSHSSLALSEEHSFTTKGVAGVTEEETPSEEFPLGAPGGETIPPSGEGKGLISGAEAEGGLKDLGKFLAAIGNFLSTGNLCWLFFFSIIVLNILYLLSRMKKGERDKRGWILPLAAAILIILHCIFCCSKSCSGIFCCWSCWILIIIAAFIFILSLLIKKRL